MSTAVLADDRGSKRDSGAGTRPIRILELRCVQGTGGGPDKTILLGAAQSDPNRPKVGATSLSTDSRECHSLGPS
jgi:hypothetical protein